MAEPEETQNQPASYDELDLKAVAGVDRMLNLPIEGGWRSFPVPGDLSIPTMARLFIIERRIDEAEESSAVQAVFEEAVGEIERIVRVRTPDAPPVDRDELGVRRIMVTLSWLAGDRSVANAIAATLTAGLDPAEAERAVTTARAASDEDTQDGEEGGGPLASNEPSSQRSSSLDGSTGGDLSGGETAAGAGSVSTSTPRTPATA